jgi:hypothetical protein
MAQKQNTQQALLIPCGQFAQEIGLITWIKAVKFNQKVYEHMPQAKVIGFLPEGIGTMLWRFCQAQSICKTSVWQPTHWTKM